MLLWLQLQSGPCYRPAILRERGHLLSLDQLQRPDEVTKRGLHHLVLQPVNGGM